MKRTSILCACAAALCILAGQACAEETASRPARLNALDFGVVAGDESVDNTAALQSALDKAGELGGAVVELPSGRFRFDGVLSIPAGATLSGTYRTPPTVVNKDEKPTGTTLLTYANRGNPEGAPFITLAGSNSVLSGLVIAYPEWSMQDVPPVPYPPCVASKNTCNVAVTECCLLNPYEGIRFELAHRHLIRNVTGYPIKRGIFVDQCYDIGHIENVHLWPFGVTYRPEDPYCKWVNVNGVAFELARTDWHYVSNVFCFGYGIGYYFSDHGHGGTNGNFSGLGADSCRRAVLVEQSQKQGLLITNGEFVGRWASEDSICVEIGEENDGAVMLNNCSFWGPVKTCVQSRQKTGRLTLNACEFVNWDEVHSRSAKAGSPAVEILAGRATLQGCSFEQGGTHLYIGSDASYVTAVGNQAPGGFRVAGEKSPLKTQFAANETDFLDSTPEARNSYIVKLGAPGDSRFIRYWYGPEKNAKNTFRWSGGESRLILPLPEGAEFVDVEIDLDAPKESVGEIGAEDENAGAAPGIYSGDKLLAPLEKDGASLLKFKIKPSDAELTPDGDLVLFLRCRSWRPVDVREGSTDERELGVVCRSVKIVAAGFEDAHLYDVCAGKKVEEEESESTEREP